jgi:hypothetical protein
MLHSTAEQSRVYTAAATTPRLDAAIAGLHLQPFTRARPLSSVAAPVRGKAGIAKKARK